MECYHTYADEIFIAECTHNQSLQSVTRYILVMGEQTAQNFVYFNVEKTECIAIGHKYART